MDFGSVKNVGTAVVDTIVKERKENGKFKSFTDFCERMQGESVNKKCIESLIKAGAFDEFGETRATLLASFETILDTINNSNKKSYQGQVTMFDLGENEEELEDIKYNFTKMPELNEKELLSLEKEMLGIYITGHPLDKIKEKIEKVSNIDTLAMLRIQEDINENNEPSSKYDGKQVKFAGIVTSVKKKYTKRNTQMAFVTIEDLYGTCEVIVFDTCFAKSSHVLFNDNIVIVDGRLSLKEDEFPKIVANDIVEFNEDTQGLQNYESNNVQETKNEIDDIDNKNVITNETMKVEKPKHLIINITNVSEEQKEKLRGAIRFFSGDKNNISISVKQDEKILPCGAIYLTEEILKEFEDIVGKDNTVLQ